MISGWTFLGLATLLCGAHFLIGLHFSRLPAEKFRSDEPGAQEGFNRLGRLFMLAAPIFWLVTVAWCFGLLGSTGKIQTIRF